MEQITQALVKYGIPVATTLAAVAISAAMKKVADYVKSKELAATDTSVEARALRVADALATCAADGVIQVENQLRPTITEVTSTGKLSPEGITKVRDEAIRLAWEQAKNCFGQLLTAAGFDLAAQPHPALPQLVDVAAAQLAGDSRKNLAADAALAVTKPSAS